MCLDLVYNKYRPGNEVKEQGFVVAREVTKDVTVPVYRSFFRADRNMYRIGVENTAQMPAIHANDNVKYRAGFHIFADLADALNTAQLWALIFGRDAKPCVVVIQAVGTGILARGMQQWQDFTANDGITADVNVYKKRKLIKVLWRSWWHIDSEPKKPQPVNLSFSKDELQKATSEKKLSGKAVIKHEQGLTAKL